MENFLNKKYKLVRFDEHYEDYLEAIGAVNLQIIIANKFVNKSIFRIKRN